MSRATRQQKAEAQLHTLEEPFSADLVAALRGCAAGRWGMFGQNDAAIEGQPAWLRNVFQSDSAHLIEMGEEIEQLRRRLGMIEPFLLFKRYLEYRQMHSANSPGEPMLAAKFLAELENRTTIGEE